MFLLLYINANHLEKPKCSTDEVNLNSLRVNNLCIPIVCKCPQLSMTVTIETEQYLGQKFIVFIHCIKVIISMHLLFR